MTTHSPTPRTHEQTQTRGRATEEQTGRAYALMLALLLGVGLTATAGQLTMTKAFASVPVPSKVSVVGLMQIVFALLFDLLLWHRRFDALGILGIALVVAPSAWLMLHNPPRRQTPIHTTG
jgi:drug/metabolite transporter (DMT)-like permease